MSASTVCSTTRKPLRALRSSYSARTEAEFDQREARLIGLQRRAEEVAAVEAGGDARQALRRAWRGAQQLIGVEGGRGGVALQRRGFLAVDALHGKQGARRASARASPSSGAIADCGGESAARRVRGSPVSSAGSPASVSAARPCSPAATLPLVSARAHSRGLVGHPGGEEGERRRRADVGVAADRDDLAGDRAVERLHRGEVGLQEAPFRLGVVGEGAAWRVAEAGRLALVERDVLLGPQIEAEIVGILGW